jgi:putative ABC transport system substrate-binding protein
MRRRAVIAAFAALASAAGRPASAQQPARVRRIGFLSTFTADDRERYVPTFEVLRERGYAEGRNLALEYRFGGDDSARLAQLAAELVQIPVDVIIAIAAPAAHAAKSATRTIPIVFSTADPLGTGLVTNLARPEGNLTGVSSVAIDLSGKQLELLHEVMPSARRVAYLGASQTQIGATIRQEYEAAAVQLSMVVEPLLVDGVAGFEAAFAAAVAAQVAAMVVHPIFVGRRAAIAELAARHRLPWIGDNIAFAQAGALLSFGADRATLMRRLGAQVARVLDGAAPGEIPVEQPTRFSLVVNLSAARALWVAIPPSVVLRADEVIE